MAGERAPFLSGGSGKMHGATGTGAQKAGVSSQEGSGSLSGGIAPEAGPSGAGFYSSSTTNKDYAGTQKPGVSGATKAGGNTKWAEGGPPTMLGNTGSRAALAGRTSH